MRLPGPSTRRQLAELRPRLATGLEVIYLHDREEIDVEAVKGAVVQSRI